MGKATELSRRRFVGSALSAAALAALPASSMADAKMQKRGNEMTTLTPYLLFDGKCQQAMEFYKSCFGEELAATKVKESPAKDFMPASQHEKIVNARLRNGKLETATRVMWSGMHRSSDLAPLLECAGGSLRPAIRRRRPAPVSAHRLPARGSTHSLCMPPWQSRRHTRSPLR